MKQLAVIFFFFSLLSLRSQSFINDSLDAYIQNGLTEWKVPGLALAIVKNGRIIKMKGYGLKDIATKSTVDEHTLFFIASNSKLFTGTALSKLHNENKLSIDDKISKYYPDYKLFEKTSTELVTIKDMLTHRIGTKTFQGDFTFWNTKLSREEIMKRMQYLQPINGFRDAYGYWNSCFMTAGMVIPKVTNKSWETYVTDEILKPLKMNETSAASNDIEKRAKNIATPYTTSFTDKLMKVPYDHWDNLGPAASIVSNVSDMSHWLMFQLDSGRYEGKTIMPWSVLQMTRDVQISTGSRKSSKLPMHFRGYGLGVFAADYNGKQIYWHTGGAAGMVSNVCFVPEENLGIVILTNNDNQNFFECLRLQILDAYLGVPYVNRSKQQIAGHNDEMKKQTSEIKEWERRAFENRNHTLPLKNYTGKFKNKLYGDIKINSSKNELEVTFNTHPDLKATLSYIGEDEWLMVYNNIEYGIFKTKFNLDKGKVKSLMVRMNEFVEYDGYEFVK
jgi:CubicO group peptidase (beta-lactamase class C family)